MTATLDMLNCEGTLRSRLSWSARLDLSLNSTWCAVSGPGGASDAHHPPWRPRLPDRLPPASAAYLEECDYFPAGCCRADRLLRTRWPQSRSRRGHHRLRHRRWRHRHYSPRFSHNCHPRRHLHRRYFPPLRPSSAHETAAVCQGEQPRVSAARWTAVAAAWGASEVAA